MGFEGQRRKLAENKAVPSLSQKDKVLENMDVKIFANNINHLTDARYFAAWGATWMCYNLSSLTITEIAAIREWVEGPKHIINIIGIEPSESAAMLTNEAIDGYLTDSIADHDRVQSLLPREVQAFVMNNSAPKASSIHQVHALSEGSFRGMLCDVAGTPAEVVAFVEKQYPSAIILAGSAEEEVGVKSFDELDEILELLEEKEL